MAMYGLEALNFNVDGGYLEAIVRGYRSGLLTSADYNNFVSEIITMCKKGWEHAKISTRCGPRSHGEVPSVPGNILEAVFRRESDAGQGFLRRGVLLRGNLSVHEVAGAGDEECVAQNQKVRIHDGIVLTF